MIIIKADSIYLPIASAEIDTLRFRYERRSQAEARSWLSRAVDSGFPCYPWFEHDPLLQPLRDDPEFLAFMSKSRVPTQAFCGVRPGSPDWDDVVASSLPCESLRLASRRIIHWLREKRAVRNLGS